MLIKIGTLGRFAGPALLACAVGCSNETTSLPEPAPPVTTSQGGGGNGGGGGAGGSVEPEPDPSFIPSVTGSCPNFGEGTNQFSPEGIDPRDVEIWVGDDPTAANGPLIFYWHGAGSSPVLEPPYGLEGIIDAVTAAGGIVAAPHADPANTNLPWFQTTGSGADDDLLLADEILACAIENVGIDLRRIHSIGMSAGGLQTSQMSYRRSGYLASVVAYSGGIIGPAPEPQDPANPLPVMMTHGGPEDVVVVSFQDTSESFLADLQGRGRFGFICDHGEGHIIPKTDGAQDAVWDFFQAHPFGTDPSPYADGLPSTFPSWCSL